MRGATYGHFDIHNRHRVSIHAPHAGRDISRTCVRHWVCVSIHAPHAGRDPQALPPLQANWCFNPRAPCGARRCRGAVDVPTSGVSIHAPHAGRDVIFRLLRPSTTLFQSTRPMRGATSSHAQSPTRIPVSIHAPHAGRDSSICSCQRMTEGFNPRAPCGARPRTGSDRGCR